jgi:hypothetical protein
VAKKLAPPRDPGEQQIDDLERDLVLGKEQLWTAHGVSAEEIARERPAVVALAKAVTDRMRDEYRGRSQP